MQSDIGSPVSGNLSGHSDVLCAASDLRAARHRFAIWTISALAVCSMLYLAALFGYAWTPFRSAIPEGLFSDFYDLQARAIFHGGFAVPAGRLGIEGFVVQGKTYTYFPPFPSILRMPVLLVTDRVDGRLTMPSMLLAWVVGCTFGTMLTWRVRVLVRGCAPMAHSEGFLWALFVAAAFGGSTWIYLGSMPYVFHEAFAWGCAATLASLYYLLRVLDEPTGRRIALLGFWTISAIWSRTTLGWGCAIGTVLAAAAFTFRPGRRRWIPALLGAAILPVGLGFAATYAKFGTPFMHPLEKQNWTAVSAQRRAALAANGGRLTSVDYLPSTLRTYLDPRGISLRRHFPFIELPTRPPALRGIGGALFDQTYRTASVPASMSLLFILSVIALVACLVRRRERSTKLIAIVMVGAAAGAFGALNYGYIAQRYLGDFLPGLLVCGAFGAAVMTAYLQRARPTVHALVLAFIVLLAAFGVIANSAIAYWKVALASKDGRMESVVRTQIDTGAWLGATPAVSGGESPPTSSAPDQLFIGPDCGTVLIGTGERFEPWALVQTTPLLVDVNVSDSSVMIARSIIDLERSTSTAVTLETDGKGSMRFSAGAPYLWERGPWMKIGTHQVSVRHVASSAVYEVLIDGRQLAVIPAYNIKRDSYRKVLIPHAVTVADRSYSVTPRLRRASAVCDAL